MSDRGMVLAMSDVWAARLRNEPESRMGYHIVTVKLLDGRRIGRVPFSAGYLDFTGLAGFWKVPFSANEIAEIVVTHDRSGPPVLLS